MNQVFFFNVVECLSSVRGKGVYHIGSQQSMERMAALITCQREWQLCSEECRYLFNGRFLASLIILKDIFLWSFFIPIIAHRHYTQLSFQICDGAKNLAFSVFSMLYVVETLLN